MEEGGGGGHGLCNEEGPGKKTHQIIGRASKKCKGENLKSP